ncbi:hypothetical protein ACFCXA_19330 [Streptomyces virginiae]|uniref:hypothetical protein n=1 Tax=Streptomyces virginiae TaxID=1961 RepID=UPI0035D73C64
MIPLAYIGADRSPVSQDGWNRLGDRLHAQALALIEDPDRTEADLAAATVRIAAASAAWQRATTARP